MKNFKFCSSILVQNVCCLISFIIFFSLNVQAQIDAGGFEGNGYFTNNLGVGTSNPVSRLSVGADGETTATAYFYSPKTSINNTTGIRSESAGTTNNSYYVAAIQGFTDAGTGYTTGVTGNSKAAEPTNSGRAYGTRGTASNADINYGIYGSLEGSNRGAAVFGRDYSSNPDLYLDLFEGYWAGYFVGTGYFKDKVGIGTNVFPATAGTTDVSNFKLFVRDGILTEDIAIEPFSNWADYVFDNDYNLLSLEAVENYINASGHLPNIPSAAEIEESGFLVKGMTIKQQEKIEELFLYAISANKEIKNLKEANETLRNELIAIQKRLLDLERQ